MHRLTLAITFLLALFCQSCVSVSVGMPAPGGAGGIRETHGVQAERDLRTLLKNSRWQWDGPGGETVVFEETGYVEHPGWTRRELVTRWEVIDRRTVLFEIEEGRSQDPYAILVFNEDATSFSGFNFHGGTRLMESRRIPIGHVARIKPEEAFQPVYNPENGHWYALVDEALTWEWARCRAKDLIWRDMQGHLATLTTPEENDWVRANLKAGETGDNWWLGGYQFGGRERDGGWRWVTGEAWSWTNWHSGEPNDAGNGHQDHLRFYSHFEGHWDDYLGMSELPFLVEFEPAAPEAGTEPERSGWNDLLQLVDPATDAVAGRWTLEDGKVIWN